MRETTRMIRTPALLLIIASVLVGCTPRDSKKSDPSSVLSDRLMAALDQVERGHRKEGLSAARKLVTEGAPVDTRGPQGRTALMHAAQIGDAKLVRFLLDKGAVRSIKDAHGTDALGYAARHGDPKIVALLAG